MLPPLVIFSLGLALMVAPLTSTVLAAAADERAGIASGVNNAVARAGALFAVAALPVAVGLSGDDYDQAVSFSSAYQSALLVCAGLLAGGGLVSWLTIPAGRFVRPETEEMGREPVHVVAHQVDCPHRGR